MFPELAEDLSKLTSDELQAALEEHQAAARRFHARDEELLGEFESDGDFVKAFEEGVIAIHKLQAEIKNRSEEEAAGAEHLEKLAKEAGIVEESEVKAEGDEPDPTEPEPEQTEPETEEPAVEVTAEATPEPELVVASTRPAKPTTLRIPRPAPERELPEDAGVSLVASAEMDGLNVPGVRRGSSVNREQFALGILEKMKRVGKPTKNSRGTEERYLLASAAMPFDDARTLNIADPLGNQAKIAAVGNPFLGPEGKRSLVASGGLCAPLTPLYDLPNFAVTDRPVRDSLPSFRADRGGVTVPTPTYIGDITTAITVITEEEDALGGTFATKSCQDLTCPTFTDVAVTIISHCREYGNLNARAWPESIAHENDLTMAAHARTAEGYLLDQIKAGSIQVTNGAETLGAIIYLVDGIVREMSSIRYVLRLPRTFRFRALAPAWLLDLLVLDQVQAQFDRFRDQASLEAYLRSIGVDVTWYLDTPSTGTSQAFAAEAAGTADDFPDVVQWAIFPEGEFIHVDGGSLELGLVRDSTLNSTNDFQMFGETFENVARIGPTQGARWVTTDLCPVGQFPPAGTARTCA